MNTLSINHKNAPIMVRNQIAFTPDEVETFCKSIVGSGFATECMVLSTCNRTEVYYVGGSVGGMQKRLSEYKGITTQHLMDYFCVYQNTDAIKHLYNVACGIHSMILGEDEILRQVKDAFALAQSIDSTGYELNTVVKGAISCAKKIKTQTKLSSTPVSVGTLTANEIFSLDIPHKTVLIIGATGKAGTIVMKNLLCGKGIDIVATIRNHNAIFDYTSQYPNVEFIDYHERYRYIDSCDVVVSATSSPHYTITHSRLLPELKTPKNRLFLDLAVPQDIDTSITEIPNVTLKNIDYFNKLSKENNLAKLQEVEKAKLIIADDVEDILKELSMHEFLPYMDTLKDYIRLHGSEQLIFKLKSSSDSQTFKSVLGYLKEVLL